MPLSATAIGALLGLGRRCTRMLCESFLTCANYAKSNGIDPWEHVLGMGIGVMLANQMVKWDAKSQEDLDKLLLKAKEANQRRYFDDDED